MSCVDRLAYFAAFFVVAVGAGSRALIASAAQVKVPGERLAVVHTVLPLPPELVCASPVSSAFVIASALLRDGTHGHVMVLYQRDGKYFIDSFFSTGGKNTESYVAQTLPDGALRLQPPNNDSSKCYGHLARVGRKRCLPGPSTVPACTLRPGAISAHISESGVPLRE